MSLLVRIYFNAVFGGLGGLMGWMLLGVFGARVYEETTLTVLLNNFFAGLLIGGSIGYFVVSVEALRDLSLVRSCRLASYGVVLGALGGAVGMTLAEWVNYVGVRGIGGGTGALHLIATAVVRGLGWLLLGVAIGVSEGVAARSLGKLSYGSVGGAVGGFIGGILFSLLYQTTVSQGREASVETSAWQALGLIILGACIGSLSALVQGVMQPASVKVMRGWQEGREYPLEKAASLLGRDEHADIALFRDMKVEKRHAFIRREADRFLLVNNQAPPEQTRVNDMPVAQACDLQDGDRIQLGNVVLRFQMRAAQARARPAPARPPVMSRHS